MTENSNNFSVLRTSLNDLIYDIGRGLDNRTLHDKTLSILLKVNEMEQLSNKAPITNNEGNKEKDEINKVERKLKRWAKKQSQVNAKILNHFLMLQKSGKSQITQSDLEEFAQKEGIQNFNSNFYGLHKIAPRNHAKIFDVNDGVVSIWEPIKSFVNTYKKTIGAS